LNSSSTLPGCQDGDIAHRLPVCSVPITREAIGILFDYIDAMKNAYRYRENPGIGGRKEHASVNS
jgi:hypothetical protein